MTGDPVDVRDLPPNERHALIFEEFEQLAPGETLTVINDHNPRPLIRQLEGRVGAFDAGGYRVEQEGEAEFVIELPKRDPDEPTREDDVRAALAGIEDPDLGGVSVLDSGVVEDVRVGAEPGSGEIEATVVVNAAGLGDPQVEELAGDIESAITGGTDVRRVQIVAGSGAGSPQGAGTTGSAGTQGISRETALERLGDVQHPDLGTDVVDAGTVTDVAIDGTTVIVSVDTTNLTESSRGRRLELYDRMGAALYNAHGVGDVRVDTGEAVVPVDRPIDEDPAMVDVPGEGMGGMPGAEGMTPLQQSEQDARQHAVAPPTLDVSGIDSVLLVASAKGGVGKSTVATQLARGLVSRGDDVGLLDADFTGPDVPRMLGIESRITEGQVIDPVDRDGVGVMSVGLMQDHPTAWNGEMVHNALFNLLEDVDWDVDTLVVDMPPGASDTLMTMLQFVPIDGVVLVTTPYPTSVADTRAGAALFREGDVPVLGAVVNMAGFECPGCGDTHDLFEGADLESELDAPILAELPFSERLRAFDGEPPEPLRRLAETVAESLPSRAGVVIPEDAIDVRGLPDHGRYQEVEDGFHALEPGETLSVVSDRHPAGLAVALVELAGGDGGPSEVFDEYAVHTTEANEWLLTLGKPAVSEPAGR